MAANTKTRNRHLYTPETFVDRVSFGGYTGGLTHRPGSPILWPTQTWHRSRGLRFDRSGEGGTVEVHGGSVLVARSKRDVLTVREFAAETALAQRLPYVDYLVKGTGNRATATVLGRGVLTREDSFMPTESDCVKLIDRNMYEFGEDWVEQYDRLSPQLDSRQESELSMVYRAMQAVRQSRR